MSRNSLKNSQKTNAHQCEKISKMHQHESESKLYTTLRVPKNIFCHKRKPHYSACDYDFLSKSQKCTLLCVCLAYRYFREKHTTLRVTEKRQLFSRIKHYSACLPKYLLSQVLSRLYLSHLHLLKLSSILCIDFNGFLNIVLK